MSSHIDRRCDAEGCSENGTLHCAGCKEVFYCGKVCQSKSWQLHKGPCKEVANLKEEAEKAKESSTTPSFNRAFCAAGCGKQRGKPGEEPFFLRCDRCLGAFYCSRECQLKAWPEHKGPCKEAVKELASIGNSIADIDKQIAEYKRDAEAGNSTAQYNLGVCYEKGTGVAIDKREAFKWYKSAAEAKDKCAQFALGTCYDQGAGVAIDKPQAVKWYKRLIRVNSKL